MKTIQIVRSTAAALALSFAAVASANAQTTAVLSFGAGVTLTVVSPTPGSEFAPVTAAGTWAATTNTTAAIVSAQLTGANTLPAGMILNAALTVPAAAGTGTPQNLSAAASVNVASITKAFFSAQPATYTLTAHAADGWVASTALTVTYTIAAGT
jgi:hypothetical protein